MRLKFEWDNVKAARNLKKHGVPFETATLVFTDPFALTEQDRIENGELRWQTMGTVEGFLLLLVAHTILDEKNDAEIIRIISARHATPKERKRYEQNYSL
jgi:uncharacterized DUF497 family protein